MKFAFALARLKLASFFEDRRANVAILFALAIVPVMALAGGAVEYSRSAKEAGRVQAAVDATVLTLARLPSSTSDGDLQTKGDAQVRAMLAASPVLANLNVTVTRSGSTITVSGSSQVPTSLASVIGVRNVPVSADSTAEWGNTRLRVALALDVTGSMGSYNKLTSMQSAATKLLTQLQGLAKQDGDVYVSIIPFAKDVNVGTSNRTGIKFSGYDNAWDDTHGSCNYGSSDNKSDCISYGRCSNNGKQTTQDDCTGSCNHGSWSNQSSCTSHGDCSKGNDNVTQSTCTSLGTCSISGNNSQQTCGTCSRSSYDDMGSCQNAGKKWTAANWNPATWSGYSWTSYTWTANIWTHDKHSTWNGCVMDRDQDYDTTNTPAGSDVATQFPAEDYQYCPEQLMGLSYDWSALNNKINALTANGDTNQGIGLAWAFQTLTSAPMSVPTLDPNYTYNQAIILLSDGLNTKSRFSNSASQIDARQKILCDNVKAKGITLYTVQVNTTNDPTSSVLSYCASDTKKFFVLTSASQIVTTFTQIGTELSNLRLSH